MASGEAPTVVMEPFGPGRLLGNRYRIARQIGKGGFGLVYFAHDEQLHQKPVVVKVLDESEGRDAWRESKFRKESEALARIDHPGVVGVLDQGATPEGKLFIVMQFVDGVTLRSALSAGPMQLSRATSLIRQTAEALTAAHDQGVCHRDLKPENIMLRALPAGREQAVIIDFGIAAVKDSSGTAATSTKVAGSPRYMAPEQLGGNPEPASDIYSLGVIAYEMVTGRLPFECNSAVELYFQQQQGVRQKPSELRPDLPAGAEAAILKALSFDPKARYARALDFGEAFSSGLPDSALEEETRRGTMPVAKLQPAPAAPELAFVLFMDVVGYSQLTTDRQIPIIQTLQDVVRGAPEYLKMNARRDLISLPTGDGMALVFFTDPIAPVQCAVELARALKAHPEIRLRMGVNTGPVYRVADINENRNVAGGGVNLAQRVMDCGDAGHILVSNSVADILSQLGDWTPWLHDFGECEVKHGVRIHIYNICRGDVGNPARPLKLGGKKKTPARWMAAVALLAVVAAASVALWLFLHRPRAVDPVASGGGSAVVQPRRTLSYYFSVRKPDSRVRKLLSAGNGRWMHYSKEMIVPAGYYIRFNFSSSQPGHLYILNEGPEPAAGHPSFNILFPASVNGSSLLNADRDLQFPAGDGFVLDAKVGDEKLFIVWSSQEIPQLEDLRRWANPRDAGAVQSPADIAGIQDFLQKNPASAQAQEQGGRTVLNQNADPLVYMVKLEHM
jgi:class 3 adenylate cyclase/predicted Ser/Thr protein kinase